MTQKLYSNFSLLFLNPTKFFLEFKFEFQNFSSKVKSYPRNGLAMESSGIQLPTNKRFGLVFTCVFFIAGVFFYDHKTSAVPFVLFGLGSVFFFITILNASLLLPLNSMWMHFGILLGRLISPIVLGLIFFGILTPISVVSRFFGRDELGILFANKKTYWIKSNEKGEYESNFENQF